MQMANLDITMTMKIQAINPDNPQFVQVGLIDTGPATGSQPSQMTLFVPAGTPDLDYGQLCTVHVKSAAGT
jgi:hypothetical protein